MMTTAEEKLHDLLHDFDAAMLVTRTEGGQLRSRPMALAAVDPNGTLWFPERIACRPVNSAERVGVHWASGA